MSTWLTHCIGALARLGPQAQKDQAATAQHPEDSMTVEGRGPDMLRSLKDLEGYAIEATDGTIGHVSDFYFDDEAWVVRFLVVETGTWLLSRRVLIAPEAIGVPDWDGRVLPVAITKEQVRRSPHIDTNSPVSREHEMLNLGYYGYTYYWEREQAARRAMQRREGDPHLRSCKDLIDYHIEATDGEIGHLESILVDEANWVVRYLVAYTSNWWLGHHVLVSPEWVEDVNWAEHTVSVDLSCEEVRQSPEYDPHDPVDRPLESRLHEHYERPAYWIDEVERAPR